MSAEQARRLVLVRHAQAESGEGRPDHERRLTEHGEQQAVATGQWLAARIGPPDLAWCSSAIRARRTWAAIERMLPAEMVLVQQELYRASTGEVVDEVARATATTMVVVGHNPTIEGALVALTGVRRGMRPSAAAVLDPDAGTLLDFWDPAG
jgi:phosphohistidine phosphatase